MSEVSPAIMHHVKCYVTWDSAKCTVYSPQQDHTPSWSTSWTSNVSVVDMKASSNSNLHKFSQVCVFSVVVVVGFFFNPNLLASGSEFNQSCSRTQQTTLTDTHALTRSKWKPYNMCRMKERAIPKHSAYITVSANT